MSILSEITRRIVSMAHPSYRYGAVSFSQEGEDLILHSFMEALPHDDKDFFRFTNKISGEKKI